MLSLERILLIFLLAISGYLFLKLERKSNESESYINQIQENKTTIEEKENKIISSSNAISIYKDQIGLAKKTIEDYKKRLDIEKVKNKRLNIALEGALKVNGEGSVAIEILQPQDTTPSLNQKPNKKININDGYLSLNANILSDSVRYKYTYTDKILFGIYEKNNGLFKPRTTTVVATMSNKNSYVDDINSLVIKERKPKLNLSLYIGYGISNQGLSPSVGLSLSRPIVTILR